MRPMTAPATALSDGSPRQCICGEHIEIGSPVVTNDCLVDLHPQCANLTSREARAQAQARSSASTSQHKQHYAGPVAVGAPDLGDLVADRIEGLIGKSRRIEREHTADRQVAEALTARPTTGRRDLGDAVADRIEIQMFGKIREAK